ncbi:Hypothetical protein CINCED_3A007411 [Cinara cedri]|uniref:Uncharacterized protein n=1 Tax=Cinara cedri TaxID=506608 RepID=A0A5E4NTK7_9HEMI|nr:Hypothetical protein CINCED_3A007411 [Cinara cedri]
MISYKYFLIFITMSVIIIDQTESTLKGEEFESGIDDNESSLEDEFEDATSSIQTLGSKLEKEIYIGTLGITKQKKDSLFHYHEVEHFLDFDINKFNTLNEECFLALLVYVKKSLYCDHDAKKKKKNLQEIFKYYVTLARVFSNEFKNVLESDLWAFYKDIRVAIENKVEYAEIDFELAAQLLIEYNKARWQTPKAKEIFTEYKSNTGNVLTKKAYKFCEKNLNTISEISLQYEKELIDHQEFILTLRNINKYNHGFQYLPTISNKFGTLLLLLTRELESLNTKFYEKEEYQMEYIIYYLMKRALEDIFRGIIHILKDIEISPYDIAEPHDFQGKTRVNVELLVLLKHLHNKVIDVTQDMHQLFLEKYQKRFRYRGIRKPYMEDFMSLYKNYEAYKQLFENQWIWLFQSLRHVSEFDQFYNKLFQMSVDEKLSYENLKQIIVEPTMNFEKFFGGVLIKNRRVQPSVIGYTVASNDSWKDPVHHETNTNQWKVMLLEFNMWLSILNENCHSFIEVLLSYQNLSVNYSFKENTRNMSNLRPLKCINPQNEAFIADKLFLRDRKELTPIKNINMDQQQPTKKHDKTDRKILTPIKSINMDQKQPTKKDSMDRKLTPIQNINMNQKDTTKEDKMREELFSY